MTMLAREPLVLPTSAFSFAKEDSDGSRDADDQ
jgi:hypothetical protein